MFRDQKIVFAKHSNIFEHVQHIWRKLQSDNYLGILADTENLFNLHNFLSLCYQ